jgi:hypothetical protein
MVKRKKKVSIPIMESVKESQEELFNKFIDRIDENSTKLSSCELRVMLLDAVYAH